jgi:adenine-specific DNA glycosylase
LLLCTEKPRHGIDIAALCNSSNNNDSSTPVASQVADQCLLCDSSIVSACKPPTSVTIFPVKLKKAAPRDEQVFVCVIERRCAQAIDQQQQQQQAAAESPSSQTAHQYLLVQRHAEGLLASLWEFPSLIIPLNNDADAAAECEQHQSATSTQQTSQWFAEMSRKMQHYLGSQLGVCIADDAWQPESIGQATHLFSHIKQQLWVYRYVLPDSSDCQSVASASCNIKWVSDVTTSAISTGTKKCLALVQQADRANANAPKATTPTKRSNNSSSSSSRSSRSSTSQPTLDRFFGK